MACFQSSLRTIVFFIVISRSISNNITCNGEVRTRDLCYYSQFCEKCNLESSITANINVTCTNNTQVFVAWNAAGRAGGALVNLGYACYWAENNTNITKFPTNFEEASELKVGSENLTISVLMPGVYCVFFGCFQASTAECYQPFTNNHQTCVGGIASDDMTDSPSSITALPSVTHPFISSTLLSTQLDMEPTTSTPTPHTTPKDGPLDSATYVIPIVLVFVALVSTTALVFSCFSFYRWRSSRSKADYNYDRQLNQLNKDDNEASLISSLFIFSADYAVVSGSTLTVFNPLVFNDNTSKYMLKEQLTDSGYARMEDTNDNVSVSTEKVFDEPKSDQDGDDSSECFCKETRVEDFSPMESPPRVFHLDLSGNGADSRHDRAESLSSGYLTTTDPMSPFPNTSGSSFRTSSSLALSSHNHLKRSPPYGTSCVKSSNTDSLSYVSPATSVLPGSNHYTVGSEGSYCSQLPSQAMSSMSDYIQPNLYGDAPLVDECTDAISLPDHDLEHCSEQDKMKCAQPQTALSSDYIQDMEDSQRVFLANHQKELDDISFHSLDCEEENPALCSKSSPALLEEYHIYSCSGYDKKACTANGDYLQPDTHQSCSAITVSSPLPRASDPDSISVHFCEEVYHSEGEDVPMSHPAHTQITTAPSSISTTCIPIETDYIPLSTTPTFTSSTAADVVFEYDIDEFAVEDDDTLSTECTHTDIHRSSSPLSMYSLVSEADASKTVPTHKITYTADTPSSSDYVTQ